MDVQPLWLDGDTITCRATSAIVGGQFVGISGTPTDGKPAVSQGVAFIAAGPRPFGVASRDKASGDSVMVYREGIVPVLAGATITAGQPLECNANGSVKPFSTGVFVGNAIADTASGAYCPVALAAI